MKKITFNCFNDFKCKADKCKHSCCVGWEIGIDKKSLKRYKKDKSCLKERLNDCIDYKKAYFITNKEKRCPFLDKNNLCDIIKTHGEKGLCQVCSDHPRFRNFFSNRIEEGFGLSCEKAVDLLFDFEGELLEKSSDIKGKSKKLNRFEENLLNYRNSIIEIILDSRKDFTCRIKELYNGIKSHISDINLLEVKNLFNSLERLDDGLFLSIENLRNLTFDFNQEFSKELERLTWYFIIRHVSGSIDNLDTKSRTLFSVLSTAIIYNLLINSEEKTIEKFKDIVREYSKEIEYSEENISKILDYTDKKAVKL